MYNNDKSCKFIFLKYNHIFVLNVFDTFATILLLFIFIQLALSGLRMCSPVMFS